VVASVPLVHVGAVPEANTQPDGSAEVATLVMPSNDCVEDPVVSEKGATAAASRWLASPAATSSIIPRQIRDRIDMRQLVS
jgi:hypothetical protein